MQLIEFDLYEKIISRMYPILHVIPGFSSNIYFLRYEGDGIFGQEEGPDWRCSLTICAKSSPHLPVIDSTY